MKLFILTALTIFALVEPLHSMPLYQDEFSDDNPDTDEFEDEADNIKYNNEKPVEYDKEFLDAQKAYEDLQTEIKRMQETLHMLKYYGVSEGTDVFENQDDNGEVHEVSDKVDEEEVRNAIAKNEVPQEERALEEYTDDANDAIEEDATQNAAQGVEDEAGEEEEEEDTREVYETLRQDEGDSLERDIGREEEEQEEEEEDDDDDPRDTLNDSPVYNKDSVDNYN